MRIIRSLFIILIYGSINVLGQSPISDFNINNIGCVEENLIITNHSTNVLEYAWDFCDSDLEGDPSYTDRGIVSGVAGMTDLRFKKEGTDWYGFVCDADGNKVQRLSYGHSISNTPVVDKVADINVPSGIDLAEIDGIWYGLIASFSQSQLYLLNFGNSLANTPQIAIVSLTNGLLINPRGIRLVQQESNYIAFIANANQPRITQINFGTLPTTEPLSVNLIEIGATSLVSIDAIEDETNKYLVVTGFASNTLYKLNFATDWTSAPLVEIISTGMILLNNPGLVKAEYAAGNYYVLLIENGGRLLRMNFGNTLTGLDPSIDNLGTFGSMINVYGMDMQRNNNGYSALFSSYQTDRLYQLDFSATCEVSINKEYIGSTPPPIQYTIAGTYPITLRVKGTGLQQDVLTRHITISSDQAPTITIEKENKQCLGEPNQFSINNSTQLNSYTWLFGDGDNSTNSTPTHSYTNPGKYPVLAEVIADNGCKNITIDTIRVFSVPSFELPSITPLCTGQEYVYENTTEYEELSIDWVWYVNGDEASDDVDLEYIFPSSESTTIKLEASNGECTNEFEQTINTIVEGPLVDFNAPNGCQNSEVDFTNITIGQVSSYSWSSGEVLSTEENFQTTYTEDGTYPVTLTATNQQGCVNTKTKNVTIFSKPVPDFSIDLPPFSCSGTPSQFHDLTPTLTDSNLEQWAWNFGNGNTSTEQDPQPTYQQAGTYPVSLTVTSNRDCVAEITKDVTILPAPQATLSITPACLEKTTTLSYISDNTITDWFWQAESNFYFTKNPVHTFLSAGTYPVSLLLTDANGCQTSLAKDVTIYPRPASIDFSGEKKCVGTSALFTATATSQDPIANYTWTFEDENKTGKTTEYVFKKEGLQEIKLRTTTAGGCEYEVNKALTVLSAPKAGFTFSPETGNAPLSVSFTNTSVHASTFRWVFNDPANSTSSEPSPSFTYTTLGSFPVDLVASNSEGCSNTVSKTIHVILPFFEIELTGLQIQKNADGTQQVMAEILNKGNSVVQGIVAELTLSNATQLRETIHESIPAGQSILYPFTSVLAGSFNIDYICTKIFYPLDQDATNNEACQSISNEIVLLAPHPNPSSENLNIEWVTTQAEQVSILILNSIGHQVLTEQLISQPGLNSRTISLDTFQNGIYFVKLRTESIEQTFQIAVQR